MAKRNAPLTETVSQKIPEAVLEALTAQTGAVDNGPAIKPKTGRRRLTPEARAKRLEAQRPVTTVRPAIKGWQCDSCGKKGNGIRAVEEHFEKTRHRRFNPDRED